MNETHNTSKHYHRIAMALCDLAGASKEQNLEGHYPPGLTVALFEKAHECESLAILNAIYRDDIQSLQISRQAIEDAIAEERGKNATQEVGNAD